MRFISKILTLVLLGGAMLSAAQSTAQDVLNHVYEEVITEEKIPIPYDHIRESDVFWEKWVWRIIDVREKINLPFKYPKRPLIEILHEAAIEGEMTVYSPIVEYADDFMQVYDPEEVKTIGFSVDSQYQINPITLQEEMVVITNELAWSSITKYRLKELWFFDEGTSSMQVRIIGLAPVREAFDQNGNYMGDETMYWIYYPNIRDMLAREDVYNENNEAVELSWEELFENRVFASYIYKETNVHDRNIQEYATGIDALLESDRITNEIREFEHDLWTY